MTRKSLSSVGASTEGASERRYGRPKGSKTTTTTYCTVRLDKSLIGMLKAMATRHGVTSADWLSDTIRPILEKCYVEMLRADLDGRSPGLDS